MLFGSYHLSVWENLLTGTSLTVDPYQGNMIKNNFFSCTYFYQTFLESTTKKIKSAFLTFKARHELNFRSI